MSRLIGEPADDVGRVGREKVISGRVEVDVAHVGRVQTDAGNLTNELRRHGIEEGDVVDDFLDDDASGVELVAGILFPLKHANAPAAASENRSARQAGETGADDGAIHGVRGGGVGHGSLSQTAGRGLVRQGAF